MSTFMTESGSAPPADGGKGDDDGAGSRRLGREPSSEDHWSIILKKLAPQGYQKAPVWQQEIIEKVVKGMAARQKDTRGKMNGMTKEQMARTIDLSALGVSPEVAELFRQEETRVGKTMRELPHPGSQGTRDASRTSELTLAEKMTVERSNKVHYYIRGIQMEQLLEQDLEADLKALRDAVGAAVTDEQYGQAKNAAVRSRLEKQLSIVQKRCNALTVKASEISSDNSSVRLAIDDLRKEKMLHREQVTRMKVKAEKMDADIAFLTHQAHQALDQREKVRGKFLMAQRDMMQEREQKLAVIAELVQRAGSLDEDWGNRQNEIADAEESRRRSLYGEGRKRREHYEAAEVRYGYLTAQARGWESEFERLQSFTGMETKFVPGETHIVDEITARYAEKERANTSLLRYLNEQQSEVATLSEQHRDMQARREELQQVMGVTPTSSGQSVEELLASAQEEDARADQYEMLLEQVCERVDASLKLADLEPKSEDYGSRPSSRDKTPQPIADTRVTVNTLERWLGALEASIYKVYHLSQTLTQKADQGEIATTSLPPTLKDWASKERTSKVPKVTVPEIHDALCLQAAQQRRGGELEEEEEEAVGEDAKREAERNRSPFQRTKVNKAQERQRIIEWARKRQPGVNKLAPTTVVAVRQVGESSTVPPAPIRSSASAPTLGRKVLPPPSSTGNLPAISEKGTKPALVPPPSHHPESSSAAITSSPEAYAQSASASSLPPPPSNAGPPMPIGSSRRSGPGGVGKAASGPGARMRAAAGSSAPSISASASAPKDLGTVIYLLGTQSNSMNARRFLDGGRNV